VARIQSAGIDVHLQPVSVQEAVMQVVASYTMAAENKNIALQVRDLPGTMRADPARLAQVLSNLLSNALKYSPQQTTVTLWSEASGDAVRISVADQGPGIPENERQRLFTEFGRLSNLPTGSETSTGLGLWIVKHLVNLQNGTVGVDNPAEGGSVFWVEFPTAESV
jgi:signal transduction histidine kinase